MLIPGLRDKAAAAGWHVDTFVGNAGAWRSPSVALNASDRAYLTAVDRALLAGHYDVIVTTARRSDLGRAQNAVLQAGMESVWKPAEAAGARIVALRDNPRSAQAQVDCSTRSTTMDAASLACGVPRSFGLGGTDNVLEAAKAADVPIVDLSSFYCTPQLCRSIVGGVVVYRDVDHLTATYGRSLAPYLVSRIRSDIGRR